MSNNSIQHTVHAHNAIEILAKMQSENENLTSITIDDDGVYKYLFNMPEEIEIIEKVNAPQYNIDTDCQLYVVPRYGMFSFY